MGDGGPLDGAIAAKGKAGLTVNVLWVPHVGTIITLIYGYVYPRSFGVRLCEE